MVVNSSTFYNMQPKIDHNRRVRSLGINIYDMADKVSVWFFSTKPSTPVAFRVPNYDLIKKGNQLINHCTTNYQNNDQTNEPTFLLIDKLKLLNIFIETEILENHKH